MSVYICKSSYMVKNISIILYIFYRENAYLWQKMPIYGCHLQLCATAMLKLLASFQPHLLVHFSKTFYTLTLKIFPLCT